jgi:hypothetical protein
MVRHLGRWGAVLACSLMLGLFSLLPPSSGQEMPPVAVEGQPLAANVQRLIQAYEFLGAPLPKDLAAALHKAAEARDAVQLQKLLDPHVLLVVNLNPEARVKASRGPAPAVLQQGGYVPVLLKILNDSTVTKQLRILSPQAGTVFAGGGAREKELGKGRFLDAEIFGKQPMTPSLSGLKVEYMLALIHSSEAGKREVTFGFDIGFGSQDLGFRAEVPVLFDIKPAIVVRLSIKDFDGQPTVGRFTFRDKQGHVYPLQAKRLAPDFFFQAQIYRPDGGTVLLPPGELEMEYGRGPEYRLKKQRVTIPEKGPAEIAVKLERWINPRDYGFYSGDHHIHAAGCAHYTMPTEGVHAPDMFLHVKGEGLNVGCNLTWGPCFEYQRQFFAAQPHQLSEPFCVLKYDIEVSGFGSQALGHVCLLNLKDQTYPGSDGTKEKGWPTWTPPLMKWAKAQGAYTGYAHSASGLEVVAEFAAGRLLRKCDGDKDGKLSREEVAQTVLPEEFARIDTNGDGLLDIRELAESHRRAARQLPNLAIPELNGIGAQEVFVTSAQGVCDFISAMDTHRTAEWNCWYHIMNCGFPLKVSGETDFPCISGSRVGEGRVYVQLGKVDRIDFAAWCDGLAKGRSYISDGYAHALHFTVNDQSSGQEVKLASAGKVQVKAKVAFARETPLGTAKGGSVPKGDQRLVELVVNGKVVASKHVPADDQIHDLEFTIPIDRSSWVALRQFPQMHTNPVTVLVGGQPIRASRQSALWCAECVDQLWHARGRTITDAERAAAKKAFDAAAKLYRQIATECPAGS